MKLFDLHNDYPTSICSSDIPGYLSGFGKNVTVTAAVWTSELANAYESVCSLTKTVRNAASDVYRIPLAIEDIGFLSEDERYRDFDFSEYLYCSLTWNFDNAFAGGALDGGRLTIAGTNAVKAVNACGCAIDVAHLNVKSFYGVFDSAERLVCSHTGFNDHPRSISDDMISRLVRRNAVIGLCTVRAFTNAEDAFGFADVIDGFVQKYGADCLAIGTDFNGSADIPADISDYGCLERVADILYRRGYDAVTVDKIFFGNADAFYNKER